MFYKISVLGETLQTIEGTIQIKISILFHHISMPIITPHLFFIKLCRLSLPSMTLAATRKIIEILISFLFWTNSVLSVTLKTIRQSYTKYFLLCFTTFHYAA